MSEEIKDIFECLKKYANLTPDAIDDLYSLEGTIEDLQQKVEQLENMRKEAVEYINHVTIGADSSPVEDSWLYNLYETRYILNKGDNNVKD